MRITIVILIFASTVEAYSQSVDSARAFYPVRVGNSWLYQYELRITNPPTRLYYYTAAIIADTVMPSGNKYYTFVRTNLSSQVSTRSFERVDSTTANIFSWDSVLTQEVLIDSLCARNGDRSGRWFCYGTHTLNLFGFPTLAKRFGVTGDTHSYGYGFGFAHSSYDGFGFPYGYSLLYARINGIEYGTSLAVDEFPTTPQKFQLYQNFPNPFNLTTMIQFFLATGAHVTLKVFTVHGQEVGTLLNELKPPGHYYVQFDGVNLPSGVYVCRMYANNSISSKIMVLLK